MIAVQDKNGNILWAKEGELTSDEVAQVITLLKEKPVKLKLLKCLAVQLLQSLCRREI